METFWRNQNAFVAIKSNHVAGSLKDCGAMTALAKMLIDCCSLNKTEISVDIIRDISPDFFAAYSHGFLTSFETHPSRPSCASPGARRSEEHTSELQSRLHLVCRLLLEKKKKQQTSTTAAPPSCTS